MVLYDVVTGEVNTRIALPRIAATDDVSFSPNGKLIVSGGTVWDTLTGEEIARINYSNNVNSSIFSPDRDLIVSNDNGVIVVWNSSNGNVVTRIDTNYSGFAVGFNPNGNQIFSIGNLAQVWNAFTGVELKRTVLGEKAIAFSRDGARVAFTNSDGIVHIGEFPTNEGVALQIKHAILQPLDFSSNGELAAYRNDDGTTRVFDLVTGQEVSRTTVNGPVVAIDFSLDGRWIAQASCESNYVNCGDANVRVWETHTGKLLYHLKPNFGIGDIKFVPNNNSIVIVGDGGHIEIWELDTGKMLSKFKPDLTGATVLGSLGDFIGYVNVDPLGQLVTAGKQIWEIETGKEIFRVPPGYKGTIFNPSGKWIASASDSKILIWEVESADELIQIPWESSTRVSKLAFSPDEKWLLGSSQNGTHVWDVSTGGEISLIPINSVTFSADGKHIIAIDNNKMLRLWSWFPEDLITEVCSRLHRNLTFEEWKQYIGIAPYQPTCTNLPISIE